MEKSTEKNKSNYSDLEPIFCKNCKHYKGEVKQSVQYPMGIGHVWKYICGLYKKSVFEFNLKNDCKDFKPKPPKRGWRSKLKFW